MFSILDIETTGNHALQHGITEIAILNFNGEKITDRLSTLIRPETDIPLFISHLTGITNEMVETAPSFEEVAEQIEEFTRGRILIAHNAHFDYSFLKQAFLHAGISFQRKTLCTLRLSRKIIPGLRSYSLDQLCRTLTITTRPVHRAESDAMAALLLFQYLKQRDQEGVIEAAMGKREREFGFPPHLPKETMSVLPDQTGIYYFLNQREKVLYVGKAKSIRHRIHNHFSGSSSTRMRTRLMNHIHRIDYQLCGNELIAMLLESSEIKKHFPPFNITQKISDTNYGLYQYEDGKGFLRFGIKKLRAADRPLESFSSLPEARTMLNEKVKEFHLCPKLCGLQQSPKGCFDHELGLCDGACCGKVTANDYNLRVREAIGAFKSDARSYAIVGKGRSEQERSVVVMEDGKYLGFGFVSSEKEMEDFRSVKETIQHQKDNREVQLIIQTYLRKNSDYQIIFPG